MDKTFEKFSALLRRFSSIHQIVLFFKSNLVFFSLLIILGTRILNKRFIIFSISAVPLLVFHSGSVACIFYDCHLSHTKIQKNSVKPVSSFHSKSDQILRQITVSYSMSNYFSLMKIHLFFDISCSQPKSTFRM